MRHCQSGGTREKIAAPPLSANSQPLPDPTLCSSQSLICSREILCSSLEWRCQRDTSPSTIPAEGHRDSQEKLHTHSVKMPRALGIQAALCQCLVWGEPSRTCLVQLHCWDRHSRAPGPPRHFRAAHRHRVHIHVLPDDGSPCPCTPAQLPGSHTQSKALANCCQAWPTPGEEEFPCKMQHHTARPATAQQGDLCLV